MNQGYETMEGASGDDWVSGAQSMRAYLRAGQICGVVSSHIRNLGYSARSHGVMDQDVLVQTWFVLVQTQYASAVLFFWWWTRIC